LEKKLTKKYEKLQSFLVVVVVFAKKSPPLKQQGITDFFRSKIKSFLKIKSNLKPKK
jgi:hypothetical protein